MHLIFYEKMNKFKILLLFIYVCFMFVNSLLNSSLLFYFLDDSIFKYDKQFHFVEFFILGILIINIFIPNLSFKLFASLLIVIFFIAVFDECLQFFIPRRYPDINDFLFDVLGGFSGMSLHYLFYRR